MSEHGATLQTYNQELVKCLEELKIKRNETLRIINKEEAEKRELEENIRRLNEKLAVVNGNLDKHRSLCDNYERIISGTENGFKKILESSETLLRVARQQSNKLQTPNET